MSVAAMVRRLTELGASAEMIAVAVTEVEAEQDRFQASEEARKAGQRERKARSRLSRDSHVTVTGQERDPKISPTPPINTTQETNPSSAHAPEAKIRQPRAHRIPDDWQPTPDDRRFATEQHGWTEPQVDAAAAEFVDHWSNEPDAKAKKLDWSKTWRNRVRRFPPPGASRNHSRNRSPEKSGVTDLLRDIEDRIRERDNPNQSGHRGAGPGAWPDDRSLDGRHRDGSSGPILDLQPIRRDDE